MGHASLTWELNRFTSCRCMRTRSTIASQFFHNLFLMSSQKSMNWILWTSPKMAQQLREREQILRRVRLQLRPIIRQIPQPQLHPLQPSSNRTMVKQLVLVDNHMIRMPPSREPAQTKQFIKTKGKTGRKMLLWWEVAIHRWGLVDSQLAKTCGRDTMIAWFVIVKAFRMYKGW